MSSTTPADPVRAAAFSPDGQRIICASADAVRVWDVASGKELDTTRHSGGAWGVAITPDGRRAIVGSDDGSVLVVGLPR